MDRRRPLGSNPVGINLLQLPVIGNALGNPQRFLSNLRGLGMPQAQGQRNMSREQYGQDNRDERTRFTDNYYDRELMASGGHGQRRFQEPYGSRNLDREDHYREDHGKIHGLMDKEIPLDYLFPEMESSRHHASKSNLQTALLRSQSESHIDTSFDKGKHSNLYSISESKYGKRDNTAIPWNAQLRPNCYLVPPLDDTHVLPLGEKQRHEETE